MIDIHCHILPGFDDGSENLEESLAMARMAVSSGVAQIVATPHFPGETASLQQLETMMDRYDLLNRAIGQENLPLKLHPGAEILCLPETPMLAARGVLPTIGSTRYLLAEFYFNEPLHYMETMLSALADFGYMPVVAHPERYKAIGQNPGVLEQWFQKGYVLQLNKGSLLGAFGSRVQNTAIQILDAGLAHIIASDAHSASRRTPHMGPLVRWLEGWCDPSYMDILFEQNPLRLVEGREMVPVS